MVSGNTGDTIGYVYNLNIVSGTINSNGEFFIDNNFNMTGGNLTINTEDKSGVNGIYVLNQVNIDNGNINIKANGCGIFVTGGKNSIDKDGITINGGNISVSSKGSRIPAIRAGSTSATCEKNITVKGGNFTLGGDLGIYADHGKIYINHINSFNADNVRNQDEIIKVSSSHQENEVIIKPADYSKVDEAISKAEKLNKSDYKNFSAVEEAIKAVDRSKNVLEQQEVNAMAEAIYNAINSLKLKDKTDSTPKTEVDNIVVEEVDKTGNNAVEGTNASSQKEVILETLKEEVKNNAELARKLQGKTTKIDIEFSETSESVEKEVKEKMEEAAKKADKEINMAKYYDIDIVVLANGEVVGHLKELTKEVELKVSIPDNLPKLAKGYARKYYIIRDHEGEVTVLDTTVSEDGKYLTFKSDRFSTYALGYSDEKIDNSNNIVNLDSSPKTGDQIYVAFGLLVVSLVSTCIMIKKLKNIY